MTKEQVNSVGRLGQAMLERGVETTAGVQRNAQAAAARDSVRRTQHEQPTPTQEQEAASRSIFERTDIVPIDELLAHKDEILQALHEEDEAARLEVEEGREFFHELQKIHAAFGLELGKARGRGREFVETQMRLRYAEVAQKLGDGTTVEELEQVYDLATHADAGEHFGHFGASLKRAESAGFFERIDDERREQEIAAGRKRFIFTHRGQSYFPTQLKRKVPRFLFQRIRDLHWRAIETADRSRAEYLAIFDAGELPDAATLLTILHPEQALEHPVTFGCMLVEYAVPQQDGQMRRYNGAAQITIANDAGGQKCIGIVRVEGGVSSELKPRSTPVVKAQDMRPWARTLHQYLWRIARASLMTDEEVAAANEQYRARKQFERIITGTASDRLDRFAVLRGDAWRAQNSRWSSRYRRQHAQAAPLVADAEGPVASAEAREMLGLLRVHAPKRTGANLTLALHPRYQVQQPMEFALFVLDYPMVTTSDGRETVQLYSGVLDFLVEADGDMKSLTLVRAVGPIATAFPEVGTDGATKTWKWRVQPPPASVHAFRFDRVPKEQPLALLAYLHKRGFDEQACGVSGLLMYDPTLRAEAERRAERQRSAPVVERKGTNGAIAADEPPNDTVH